MPAGSSSSTGVIELWTGPILSERGVSIQAVGQAIIMTSAFSSDRTSGGDTF